MSEVSERKRLLYADYLLAEREAEAQQEAKHEYLRGEVWAMAGGSPEHGRLAMRVAAILTRLLEGKPCELFSSDVRVRIEATDLATYPDLSVVCEGIEAAGDDPSAVANPMLLVEVLSDSTEAYDRGEKWAHYQRLESLEAYLLVSQRAPRIELFSRTEDGGWSYAQATAGQRLAIPALGGSVEVDEVYRDPLA